MRFLGLRLRTHLLIALGLTLALVAYTVVANWETTFGPIVDNVAAMNEGAEAAADLASPADLVDYLAAHPETTSLVAYDVGADGTPAAADRAVAYRADAVRPVVRLPRLMLAAAYARRVEAGTLDPARRVPLSALRAFALPTAGAERHAAVVQAWRDSGYAAPGAAGADAPNAGARGDTTVALRHVVAAVLRAGDDAAADWLLLDLGRAAVDSLPAALGLAPARAPLPRAGLTLTWMGTAAASDPAAADARVERLRALPPEAVADSAYRLARRLARDAAFRARQAARLRDEGSGLALRQQTALARATYPPASARAYAAFLARLAPRTHPDAPPCAPRLRALVERPVADSLGAPVAAVASEGGAVPGLVTLAGYARRPDGSARVVVLALEGVPLAVFSAIVRQALDRGLLVQLLTDDAVLQRARTRLLAARET